MLDKRDRLSEGHFAQEAIDELVGAVTQETFMHKIVVILAGYDKDMNQLMAVNSGLSSRFPEEIFFRNMPPEKCLELLKRELKKKCVRLAELDDPSSSVYAELQDAIMDLSELPSWGNARDIITLGKKMVSVVYKNQPLNATETTLTLAGQDAVTCVKAMLHDQRERCTNMGSTRRSNNLPSAEQMAQPPPPLSPPPASISTSTATKQKAPPPKRRTATPPQDDSDGRDPGVSGEVWRQLQADKKKAELLEKQRIEAIRKLERQRQDAARKERTLREEARKLEEEKRLAEAQAKETARIEEIKRKLEAARLAEVQAKMERDRLAAELAAKRAEEERARREEARVQAKLQELGVCAAGYRWIRQSGGYRCSAGGHYISNSQLGI